MKHITALMLVFLLLIGLTFSGCDVAIQDQEEDLHVISDHKDENDDGLCDICSESVLVNLDFYAVNDLHGKLRDTASQPGVDELSTYLRRAYFSDENVILFSSGDMWQGSSESNLTRGFMMTEWMNDLDFTSMTLGNHEYDWGEDAIIQNHKIAEFPFLGINIYDRTTNSRVDYCEPSIMVEKSGVKIGIIGAMGDCYSSIAADHTKEIYFITGNELTELVKKESNRLRESGADIIVYSIHDGYGGTNYSDTVTREMLSSYYDVSLSDGYVDLVFEAHTHKFYVKEDQYGVYHLQGGGDNNGISYVDMDYNTANRKTTVNTAEFIGTEKYITFSDDPIVEDLMEKYKDSVSIGDQVLGYNGANRSGNDLRSICADLYYQKGLELWGDDYNIVLGGGFFSVRAPGSLEMGNVTYSQLQMLFPFDNHLVLCSIQGKDLKEKFFETDHRNYFISYGQYGSQVRVNLDPNETYYIVVDSYTSTYAPNKLTEIVRYAESIFARDLLAEHIQSGALETK